MHVDIVRIESVVPGLTKGKTGAAPQDSRIDEEGVLLEEVVPHDLGLETLVVVEVPRLHRPC